MATRLPRSSSTLGFLLIGARVLRDRLWRRLPPPRRFDVAALPPPPWVARPDWPADSIGWRMGGEIHFHRWRALYAALTPPEQAAVERAHPPPAEWLDYLAPVRRG